MSLDPRPSDAELLRIREERLGLRPPSKAEAKAVRQARPRMPVTLGTYTETLVAGEIEAMAATIHGAPRSKKNHKVSHWEESPGYVHWRNGVVQALTHKRQLPDQPYNLEARFYVDKSGEQADLVGLLQGFADALENAGTVSNDQWFRGFDGSRKVHGQTPRVEFRISPLKEPSK